MCKKMSAQCVPKPDQLILGQHYWIYIFRICSTMPTFMGGLLEHPQKVQITNAWASIESINSMCVCNFAESDIKASVHPQKSPKERVHRAGVKYL